MDKTINKFIAFLNKKIDEYHKKNAQLDSILYKAAVYIKGMLEVPRDKWKISGIIYYHFRELSILLEDSPLLDDEKTEIILYFINRSLYTGVLDNDDWVLDIDKIKKHKFKTITPDELEKLIYGGRFNILLRKDEDELTKLEKAQIEELLSIRNSNKRDISIEANNHKLLKEHLLDKLDSFTDEDLQICLKTFGEMGLSDSLLISVKNTLSDIKNRRQVLPFDRLRSKNALDKYLNNIIRICHENEITMIGRIRQGMLFFNDDLIGSILIAAAIYSFIENSGSAYASKTIIGNLSLLNESLCTANLVPQEKAKVILHIILENIKNGILDEGVSLVVGSNHKMLNARNLEKAVESIEQKLGIAKFYSEVYEDTYMSSIVVTNSVREINEELAPSKFSLVQSAHSIIKEHYFDKLDSYDFDDIVCVCNVLSALGLSPLLIKSVKNYMKQGIKERSVQVESVAKRAEVKQDSIKKEEVISKKTYNVLYRKLLTYFDFDSMQAIRYLSVDETIYAIALAQKLNVAKNIIDEFIVKSEKFNRSADTNPVTRYLEMYDKMSYYKNNPEISTLLDEMDSAFKEMFICGDDDYAFLKDYIELGLEQMTTMMPNSYEYEFSKARKKQI